VGSDLRYAVRTLLREPGFTAVALLTLGLVVGANNAIFSVASSLLLRPLPLPHAEELVEVFRHFPQGEPNAVSTPIYFFLRDRMAKQFADTAAFEAGGPGFNLVGNGAPEHWRGARVTASFFATVGTAPLIGRGFAPQEDIPGGPHVVVLSHGLWVRRFASDRQILGRRLQLNGESYAVVGVMPAAFRFPSTAEVWTPLALDPASTEIASYFEFLGRLKPGVTLAAASAQARQLAPEFRAAFPNSMAASGTFAVRSLQDHLYGSARSALVILMLAVGAVLLIAGVNLASLQLARTTGRRREIAIRAALGAPGGRILRQLLTESLLLAFLGGLLGLLIGALLVDPLLRLSPLRLDSLSQVGVDSRVILFAAFASLLVGLVFGLVPALQASHTDPASALSESTARIVGGGSRLWLRRVLVVLELCLALVLITCASLMVRSFMRVVETGAGFTTEHVIGLKLSLPIARYGQNGQLQRFGDQLTERLEAIPGVRAAALTTSLPLEQGPALEFQPAGSASEAADHDRTYEAHYRAVGPDLFKTLGMSFTRGRGFTAADQPKSALVVIINEAVARRVFPHQDPVGRQIVIGGGDALVADSGPRTIVGVVRDTRENGLDQEAPPVLFVPLGQIPDSFLQLLLKLGPQSVAVRTDFDSPALVAQMKEAIWAVDPAQPIDEIRTMREIRAESLGTRRFLSTLLTLIAALAFALSIVGVYGVVSYLARQRTREIGVRVALGASVSQILRLVLGQNLVTISVGVALGIGLSFAAARMLSSELYGVTASDPVTFLFAPAVLGAVALLAAALPARRASRIDPLDALRD
jgi:putative ABC transport system permease protein